MEGWGGRDKATVASCRSLSTRALASPCPPAGRLPEPRAGAALPGPNLTVAVGERRDRADERPG